MQDKDLLTAILSGGAAEDKALDFIYNGADYRNDAQKIYATFDNIKLKTWLDIFHDTIIQLVKSIRMGKYQGDSPILVYFMGLSFYQYLNRCFGISS